MRRALKRLLLATAIFAVAATAGYWLSSQLGREALRREAEAQLGRLLQTEVSIEATRLGLGLRPVLEGANLQANYLDRGNAAVRARLVTATIDPVALLFGRFRVDRLRIEGLALRLARNREGRWNLPFLAGSGGALDPTDGNGLESALEPIGVLERWTRGLLGRPLIARRIEVEDSTVALHDAVPGPSYAPPLVLNLAIERARLDHDWLSRHASLALTGVLGDEHGHSARIELAGSRREDSSLRLALAATALPLSILRAYATLADPTSDLGGELSGAIVFESSQLDHAQLEIDWRVRDLTGALPLGKGKLRLDSPLASVQARIEFHPGRVRLASAQLRGHRFALDVSGVAERPLDDRSQARLRADLRGADLDLVRRAVAALPAADAEPLKLLLSHVHRGEIQRLGGVGTANLGAWRRLLAGQLADLPAGFVVSADVADLEIALGPNTRLRDLSAAIEWTGDRITLSDGQALWNDKPLPRLDIVADGISRLLGGEAEARQLRPGAAPLPGLRPLWQILSGDRKKKDKSRVPVLDFEIDEFHHPALHWPLRDARLHISPIEHGAEFRLLAGRWAGVSVQGEAVSVSQPERHVRASLWVGERPDDGAQPSDTAPALDGRAPAPDGAWASGRIRSGALGGRLPVDAASADFSLVGDVLELRRVKAELRPHGEANLAATLELDLPDHVHGSLDFSIQDADLGVIAGSLGLPEDLATGMLIAHGNFAGRVTPGRPLYASLDGSVRLEARNGEIRKRIPLISAVAHASEGFNPFAAREVVQFDRMEGRFAIASGIIKTEEFTVDGPVRAFASGKIDLLSDPQRIKAVVGIFMLRQADLLLGKIPIIKWLVPGSNRGLLGAYFTVRGPLSDPKVTTHAARSLVEGLPLPDVVRAPFQALRLIGKVLLGDSGEDQSSEDREPRR